MLGAWKAIWDKTVMQSQLVTEFANCFQMPDKPMKTFLNKINEICARMVTDHGDDMKRAQVVKGVIDDLYSFICSTRNPKGFVVERFLCKNDRSSDSDCGYCSGAGQEEISDWGF
jgi:hypothetical protein